MNSDEFDYLLYKLGPCLSSEVVEILASQHGLSKVAARQRVSRAGGENVKRIRGLFPRREVFIYHKNKFGSDEYWSALVSRLLREGSAVGRALIALRGRGGIMPFSQFEIECGSPIALKKHLSHGTVLDRLRDIGLVSIIEIYGIGKCIALMHSSGEYGEAAPALNARLLAEHILLDGIRTWARNTGFVSYDKVQIRSENDKQPDFSQFSWDLSAPSYVGGLVSLSANNQVMPGFFVADVKLGCSVSVQDIQPFIYKCVTTRSLKRSPRCIQFIVSERFDKEAFIEAKKNGILPVTPESLFGKDVAKSIRLLISVLTEIGNQVMDLDKLNSIFAGLSKFEGAIANLRGALFEYMIANILQATDRPNRIEMNYVTRTFDGQKAESDISLVCGSEARFIECKGYSPYSQVPDEEVLKWLHDRIPKVRTFCLEQHDWKDKKLVFEFWTTGKLSSEVKNKLDKAIKETKKYKIRVFEATDVRDQAKLAGQDIYALFNQHFFDDSHKKSVTKTISKATSLAQPTFLSTDFVDEFLNFKKGV